MHKNWFEVLLPPLLLLTDGVSVLEKYYVDSANMLYPLLR